ncbi:hypothetical protein ACJX0J_006217, partial [Zea mays]
LIDSTVNILFIYGIGSQFFHKKGTKAHSRARDLASDMKNGDALVTTQFIILHGPTGEEKGCSYNLQTFKLTMGLYLQTYMHMNGGIYGEYIYCMQDDLKQDHLQGWCHIIYSAKRHKAQRARIIFRDAIIFKANIHTHRSDKYIFLLFINYDFFNESDTHDTNKEL